MGEDAAARVRLAAMSHFWAPSPPPAPPPSKPRLWRRWSELELLGTRGRYRVTRQDVEDSPPARRSLASLCAGRRRSRHDDADPRTEAGARFRARSSPNTPAPEQIYHVTATLLTHPAADAAASTAVLTFSQHTPTLLPPPRLRPVSTSGLYTPHTPALSAIVVVTALILPVY